MGEPRLLPVPQTGETLSIREVEVLRLVAAGASNADRPTGRPTTARQNQIHKMENGGKMLEKFLWSAYSFITSREINSRGGDITITNARVWTGDPADPWKSAMTVRGGKIVAMNADDPAGEVIDAKGRLIVPGFWDGHTHPQTPYVLTSPEAPMLFDAQSVDDVLDTLREYLEAHAGDKYPRLFGWMDAIFEAGERPTRQLLDKVVSDRPVYLVHHSGHAHWTNTKALEIAGILEKDRTAIPNTGHIERDSVTGLATGYLEETELGSTHGILLSTVKKVQPLTFEEQVLVQRTILEEYSAVGVTSIWTKDGDLDITRIYEQILRDDALPVRAILDNLYTPFSDKDDLERFAQRAEEIVHADLPPGFLRADGVKLMVDLPYQTWTFEPYADDPTNYGRPVYEMDEFRRQVLEADRLGLHINLLTMGDRAAHEGLNVLEQVAEVNPPRERRHTLEHAEWLIDADLPRFQKLGVVVVMNPGNLDPSTGIHALLERRAGKERLDSLYHRYKDLVEAGAIVVNGSDFPLASMDPLLGIHLMVNGTDVEGRPPGGVWPHKLIGIEDALRTYTVNAAYAAFEEDRLGMLKPGYEADFVMLSDDILDESFDPLRLARVKAVLTVLNGHVVHQDWSDAEKAIKS